MGYKYTVNEWDRIKKAREQEDRDTRSAYAEDMDNWSALREEQAANEHVLAQPMRKAA